MANFSKVAWRKYCGDHIRPQIEEFPERIVRLDRLMQERSVYPALAKLAADLSCNWDSRLGPLTWEGALHQVVGTILSPPSIIDKQDPSTKRWLDHLRKSGARYPLLVGAKGSKDAEGRWIALYLKTWIIPVFFNRPHYATIATLVTVALELDDGGLAADDVRAVKPFHSRISRRKS